MTQTAFATTHIEPLDLPEDKTPTERKAGVVWRHNHDIKYYIIHETVRTPDKRLGEHWK